MSDGASGEPGGTHREPRSAMRLLPWLLLPLILIPLVLAIIRTRRTPAPVADTTAPAAPDSVPVYQADSSPAVPAAHPAQRTHPATQHPDSAKSAHKEGLITKVGKEVDKLGGGNAPVTPDGQGAMGGDGPTGMGRASTDTAKPKGQPTGAMGGDGPPGKR